MLSDHIWNWIERLSGCPSLLSWWESLFIYQVSATILLICAVRWTFPFIHLPSRPCTSWPQWLANATACPDLAACAHVGLNFLRFLRLGVICVQAMIRQLKWVSKKYRMNSPLAILPAGKIDDCRQFSISCFGSWNGGTIACLMVHQEVFQKNMLLLQFYFKLFRVSLDNKFVCELHHQLRWLNWRWPFVPEWWCDSWETAVPIAHVTHTWEQIFVCTVT